MSQITSQPPVRFTLFLGFLFGLAGCLSTAVEVDEETHFPIPLVQKIPLTVGLHLSEEMLAFTHVEDLGDNGNFSIDIGDAQLPVFSNLLTGMFDNVVRIDDPTQPLGDVAGTLVPTIAEMQFSTPLQTRTEYFEVWIRYRFTLFSRDGVELGDWQLTAYGKANTQNYGLNTTPPTVRAAALQACRDAMAFFTIQFTTVDVVRNWLKGELGGGSS